ncbi:glycoside hydrolase family 32 protein [Paenibacillus sp. EKM202P]|uniref:glycoside hydrolase family 32 protein n=1 Tax=unclassified Paenibacillus TaxID=185978 RepID=UPI0013ECABF8|nr:MULTISPECIES: glycoside hydrolase family 32 protein [unclassified Paenibacillus]KAF6565879.1 glycoside hydrolase family 32 protein [Paenibacillus sp. EKM202P]KAF6572574.1 glycoside hydrolase family 32 protein [Paenibacillus sp. EKM207P]
MNKSDAYHLKYHITPPYGLLNDPNGLAFFNQQYHVFYQWNPKGTEHRNKCWGHVASSDLVHWQRKGVALEPSEWYDKDGIYSGGAIVHDEKLYLFYTGNVIRNDGVKESYQCAAISEDGDNFHKIGPLFEHPQGYTRHVRDPKVWRDRNGSWWLIVGAQREDLTGDTLIYKSTDLSDWEYQGSFLDHGHEFGYMWECPDLLQFAENDIFVFSPQGLPGAGEYYRNPNQSGYIVGKFMDTGKFSGNVAHFKELDRGFDFYAPQSFKVNDRTIMFGWMSAMNEEAERAVPTIQEGWIHALTLPREIVLSNGVLYQKPLPELQLLRLDGVHSKENIHKNGVWMLPSLQVECIIHFSKLTENFKMIVRNAVEIDYDSEENSLTVWRTNWLTNQREYRKATLVNQLVDMQIFIESSSLEIFMNEGEEVFSLRYFLEDTEQRSVILDAGDNEGEIEIYQLQECGAIINH